MIMLSENAQKSIIFSDECKFNLLYSDGKHSVWRKPGTGLHSKNICPTLKFGGGSVMVWACFSYHGVGKLVFIDGIMDAVKYVTILSENLELSASKMGLNEYIFQQDNDPKRTSKLAKQFFANKNINLLERPSQSPDLNPIENLWSIIKGKVAEKCCDNVQSLKVEILRVWNETSIELTQKLSLSFKKRACAVYKAGGAHTKY